jgi:group I intron endonuclease
LKFKQCSVALDNAIRKYGYDNFKVELLRTCKVDELDMWESHYINEFQTFHPNGYNLTSGGKSNCRQSDATKEKRRVSMMGKNKGKVLPKRTRKRDNDVDLPKYVRYICDTNVVGKEGYRISHHPLLKDKCFVSKALTLSEKLELALQYLNSSDTNEMN